MPEDAGAPDAGVRDGGTPDAGSPVQRICGPDITSSLTTMLGTVEPQSG